jgi:hypothetical protein
MRRRSPTEAVEPYRRRIHGPQGNDIRDRLSAWAEEILAATNFAPPEMPGGIEDRDADVWEPLLTVGQMAGPFWIGRARAAAMKLVKDAKSSSPSLGVRLLADMRRVFGNHEALFTSEIIKTLCALPEAPWSDLRGKEITDRTLAHYLKDFGVTSKLIRIGADTARGYSRDDLHDPWGRYLRPEVTDVTDSREKAQDEDVTDVTLSRGGRERTEDGRESLSESPRGSVTSITPCTRCAGEGCRWCGPRTLLRPHSAPVESI